MGDNIRKSRIIRPGIIEGLLDRSPWWARMAFALGVAAVYVIAFFPLYPLIGITTGALISLPLIAIAWLLGLRPSLIAGLLVLPLNTLLYNMAGLPGWDVIILNGGGPGSAGLMVVGVLIGYLSNLRKRMRHQLDEYKHIEETLRESEERFRQLVENANDTIYRTDSRGYFTYASSIAVLITGYSEEEITNKRYLDLIRSDHLKRAERFYTLQLLRKIPNTYYEFPAITKNGEEVWIGQNVQLVREGDQIVGFQAVARDITDRKRSEGALRQSEERYRQVLENSPNPIFSVNKDGIIQTWNQACENVLGYGADIIGHDYGKILADRGDNHSNKEILTKVFDQECSLNNVDMSLRCKDGTLRFMVSRLYPLLDHDGKVESCVFANTDITDRVQAEELIKESLQEKEILLKEIHHRVKNNLQIISSLLNLQAENIKEEDTLEMIEESQNRIRSMALIHEKLYGSKDLTQIDFGEYIGSLADYLYRSYGVNTQVISLKVDANDILLGIDMAIPCGLILNELVSNSLKHAFPDGLEGQIFIDFHRIDHHGLILMVSDNGVGFPQTLDFSNTQSLGLQLVTTLVEQLEGRIELDRDKGTRFKITFSDMSPLSEHEKGS